MDPAAIRNLSMPATYGQHLVREFPAEKVLSGTGLCAQDLEPRDTRVAVWQALRFASNASRLASEPDWYFEWGSRIADHFHGPISVALQSSPTLGDGLDAYLRYFPGRFPAVAFEGGVEGSEFAATLSSLLEFGRLKPMLVEISLLFLYQYLCRVYAIDMRQARIELAYPETSYAERYARYFQCPVWFGRQRNALVIPAAWREMPNLGFSASTWAHALAQCAETLGNDRNTIFQIRRLLLSTFESPSRRKVLPTLSQIADQFHLSQRTLIRRLRELGTTYQAITDEFLKSRACELLGCDDRRIKEIAAALGFKSPANFGKAFKRWCGVSPGAYRRRQRPRVTRARIRRSRALALR
jgi:AraC-like DNA-binding protein